MEEALKKILGMVFSLIFLVWNGHCKFPTRILLFFIIHSCVGCLLNLIQFSFRYSFLLHFSENNLDDCELYCLTLCSWAVIINLVSKNVNISCFWYKKIKGLPLYGFSYSLYILGNSYTDPLVYFYGYFDLSGI